MNKEDKNKRIREKIFELRESFLQKIEKGEISFNKLELELAREVEAITGEPVEPKTMANLAALLRRNYLEKKLGVSLTGIASTIIDFGEVYGRNIENPIGAVQVPMGVVGPLLVKGEYAEGSFYVPMATSEGALIASVQRGVKALTRAGGVRTRVLRDGMTRAPLLWTESVEEAVRLRDWVLEHFDDFHRIVATVTRHGKLLDVFPYIVGNLLWLRFRFFTGDAMGMNMVTIASDRICDYIVEKYPRRDRIACLAVSGNMCSDKKPAVINRLLGRGKSVVAEAVVPREVLQEVLRVDPEPIHYVNMGKNLLGSAAAGSPSYNAHVANIIAAIFLATGQDMAQVVESSLAFTWTELREEGLYISVTLPSLEVATVGGGTRLPTQREALSIMGVAGGGDPPGSNARKFAEIIAATALAGELNLLAALVTGELARAHELLGRGKIHESYKALHRSGQVSADSFRRARREE